MSKRIIIVESAQELPPRLFARRSMRVAAWKAFMGTFLCLTLLFIALVVTVVQPQWIQAYLPLQAFAIESEQSLQEQTETMPARKVNVPSLPALIPVKSPPQEASIMVMDVPEFPSVTKINEVFLEEEDLNVPLDKEIKSEPKKQQKQQKPQAKRDIAQNKKSDNQALDSMAGTADQKAQPKHTPFPPYPRDAKNAREEGTVILRIFLNPQGKPTQVAIAQSSGFQSLDTAAQTWVKQNWSFHPAMAKDIAIASTLVQRLRFVLN